MDNKTLLATLGVLRQLEGINGMPLKFTYAIVRNINAIDTIEQVLQKMQQTEVPGQPKMNEAKLVLLQEYAKKDENGKPITKANQFGQSEYDIEDWAAFEARMDTFKEEYKDVFEAMDQRQKDMQDLMEEEADNFEPYVVNVKYLPMEDGNCRLSVTQLRMLMPFLDGDIDELPDA